VLIRSLSRLRDIDIGVKAENLLTMKVFLPATKYAETEVRTRIVQQIVEGLRTAPGIRSG